MSYETALILASGLPALMFTFFTFSFDEGKGAYKHFFSLMAMLFCWGTLTTAMTFAYQNGDTVIRDSILAPMIFILQILMGAWLLIFLFGIAVWVMGNLLGGNKKQADQKSMDISRSV